MDKNRLIPIVIAILVLAGIGVFLTLSGNNDPEPLLAADTLKTERANDGEREEVIPLDKMDLPDVVAVINGQEISRDQLLRDYSQMRVLYESAKIDTSLPETLAFMKEALISDMITTTLLAQEADRAGINVDESRVDAEISKAISRFSSEEEYRSMLTKLNLSESAFREKLKRQQRISDLIKRRVDEVVDSSDGLQFTEEEKRKMYAIIDNQLGGLPSYEEVQDTVDQMLEYNKVQVILGDYIQTLIDESEVEILIQ